TGWQSLAFQLSLAVQLDAELLQLRDERFVGGRDLTAEGDRDRGASLPWQALWLQLSLDAYAQIALLGNRRGGGEGDEAERCQERQGEELGGLAHCPPP